MGQRWPVAGYRALSVAEWAEDLLKEITIIFITSTMVWSQIKQQRGNTALPIKQKIGLKIYWALPCPSEQDPVPPTVNLSQQEASISLLSFSIRGQTEWKPQSQKTNQTDHMDHSLIQLNKTISMVSKLISCHVAVVNEKSTYEMNHMRNWNHQ